MLSRLFFRSYSPLMVLVLIMDVCGAFSDLAVLCGKLLTRHSEVLASFRNFVALPVL